MILVLMIQARYIIVTDNFSVVVQCMNNGFS